MTHTCVYVSSVDGTQLTFQIEWPDWANVTPPSEIVLFDNTGSAVTYFYASTSS